MTTGQDDATTTAPASQPASPSEHERPDALSAGDGPTTIDRDVLRGWKEYRDPTLNQPHRLPALAQLLPIDPGPRPLVPIDLHGPDLLLGRFQSHYAPVDIGFRRLEDHQLYRLGAPHIRLTLEGRRWHLEVLTPRARTMLNDRPLSHLQAPQVLADGDTIHLGVAAFEFRTTDQRLENWLKTRQNLFSAADKPTLFLKRYGGCCGPFCSLQKSAALVIGRTYPTADDPTGRPEWPAADRSWWDLSGLGEDERKYVAFRHAQVALHQGQWTLKPLSTRHRTFLNRIAISGTVPLAAGDELGLGSVLLQFYDPQHPPSDGATRPDVPAIVDWSEGQPPSIPPSKSSS